MLASHTHPALQAVLIVPLQTTLEGRAQVAWMLLHGGDRQGCGGAGDVPRGSAGGLLDVAGWGLGRWWFRLLLVASPPGPMAPHAPHPYPPPYAAAAAAPSFLVHTDRSSIQGRGFEAHLWDPLPLTPTPPHVTPSHRPAHTHISCCALLPEYRYAMSSRPMMTLPEGHASGMIVPVAVLGIAANWAIALTPAMPLTDCRPEAAMPE